jgi:hypothetical protein
VLGVHGVVGADLGLERPDRVVADVLGGAPVQVVEVDDEVRRLLDVLETVDLVRLEALRARRAMSSSRVRSYSDGSTAPCASRPLTLRNTRLT